MCSPIFLEQTYKVQEYDVASEDEIKRLVTGEFIASALKQFEVMRQILHEALHRI